MRFACKWANRSPQSMFYALKNKTKCGGYNWIYLDEDENK